MPFFSISRVLKLAACSIALMCAGIAILIVIGIGVKVARNSSESSDPPNSPIPQYPVKFVMTDPHGTTLLQNAVCATSENNLLLFNSLVDEGDENAVQILFQKGLIRNLNGVEIVLVGETYDENGYNKHGIAIIRVVGTVDFYYVGKGEIGKSPAEIREEKGQARKLAQDEQAAHVAQAAQDEADLRAAQAAQDKAASDEAYKALFPTPDPGL